MRRAAFSPTLLSALAIPIAGRPGGYPLSDIYLYKCVSLVICRDGTSAKGGHVKLSSAGIRVATEYGDEDGLLIFVGDALIAVISQLQHEVDGELCGKWFLEAGFGPF
jgi:hypothetical protein